MEWKFNMRQIFSENPEFNLFAKFCLNKMNIMNETMLAVIDYAIENYEKVCAKKMLEGDLYLKLYTERNEEEVLKEFEEKFDVKEIDYIYLKTKLIADDIENGVELFIVFHH